MNIFKTANYVFRQLSPNSLRYTTVLGRIYTAYLEECLYVARIPDREMYVLFKENSPKDAEERFEEAIKQMIQGKSIRMNKDEREVVARLLSDYIDRLRRKCMEQAQRNESNYNTFREIQQLTDLRGRLLE